MLTSFLIPSLSAWKWGLVIAISKPKSVLFFFLCLSYIVSWSLCTQFLNIKLKPYWAFLYIQDKNEKESAMGRESSYCSCLIWTFRFFKKRNIFTINYLQKLTVLELFQVSTWDICSYKKFQGNLFIYFSFLEEKDALLVLTCRHETVPCDSVSLSRHSL